MITTCVAAMGLCPNLFLSGKISTKAVASLVALARAKELSVTIDNYAFYSGGVMNFFKRGGNTLSIRALNSVCGFHFSSPSLNTCSNVLLVVLLAAYMTGCATPSLPSIQEHVPVMNKGNTYLDSSGTTNAQKRIDQQLREANLKRRERVFWGGVALVGDGSNASMMPLSSKLVKDLQSLMTQKLQDVNPKTFDLRNTGTGSAFDNNFKDQDGLVMAVAIESEETYTKPYTLANGAGEHWTYWGGVKIRGQLLFMDISRNLQITAGYPWGIELQKPFDHTPGEDDYLELAREALTTSPRVGKTGKATCLLDQILDQLQGNTTVPRAWVEPVAVKAVTISDDCSELTIKNIGEQGARFPGDLISRWSDDFAREFAAYLVAASGLAVNPYIRTAKSALKEDNLTSQMAMLSMRTVDRKILNASLRPPRIVFHLQIDNWDCKQVKAGRFTTDFAYGFVGVLSVSNPDTGAKIISLPIHVPAGEQEKLPKALSDKYAAISMVHVPTKILSEGVKLDHAYYLRNTVDNFLLQISKEILYDEEDIGRRFVTLRQQLKRSQNAM